jgi:hypothetical protein
LSCAGCSFTCLQGGHRASLRTLRTLRPRTCTGMAHSRSGGGVAVDGATSRTVVRPFGASEDGPGPRGAPCRQGRQLGRGTPHTPTLAAVMFRGALAATTSRSTEHESGFSRRETLPLAPRRMRVMVEAQSDGTESVRNELYEMNSILNSYLAIAPSHYGRDILLPGDYDGA